MSIRTATWTSLLLVAGAYAIEGTSPSLTFGATHHPLMVMLAILISIAMLLRAWLTHRHDA
jgi:hypothetical protein